jgi:hypothetical protein
MCFFVDSKMHIHHTTNDTKQHEGERMSTSKQRTVVVLENDIKKKAVQYAKKDRRTLAAIINIALEHYLKGVDYSEDEAKEEDVM